MHGHRDKAVQSAREFGGRNCHALRNGVGQAAQRHDHIQFGNVDELPVWKPAFFVEAKKPTPIFQDFYVVEPVYILDRHCTPMHAVAAHVCDGLPDQLECPFQSVEYLASYHTLANHKTNTAHSAIAYLTSAATPLAATSTAAFHPEVAS